MTITYHELDGVPMLIEHYTGSCWIWFDGKWEDGADQRDDFIANGKPLSREEFVKNNLRAATAALELPLG